VTVAFYSEPPYFLLIASLLAGITSGFAFKATLEQLVRKWSRDRSINLTEEINRLELLLPFFGIGIGICVFLASGLQIFTFPIDISYIFSVPLTLLTSGLVWWQLGKLLEQLMRGGSQALDLDSFF
jgi:uncharacterized protein (DUF2062 family)